MLYIYTIYICNNINIYINIYLLYNIGCADIHGSIYLGWIFISDVIYMGMDLFVRRLYVYRMIYIYI